MAKHEMLVTFRTSGLVEVETDGPFFDRGVLTLDATKAAWKDAANAGEYEVEEAYHSETCPYEH